MSNAYEHQLAAARAESHTAEAEAKAQTGTLDRQLKAAEVAVAEARTAIIKAKDDKSRIKAANAALTASTAERDRLMRELTAAQTKEANAEGTTIQASGEFAAIAFIAAATGTGQDIVAHLVILVIASLPDILAVLLLVAAGFTHPIPAGAPTTRSKAARKGWEIRRRAQARMLGPQLAFAK